MKTNIFLHKHNIKFLITNAGKRLNNFRKIILYFKMLINLVNVLDLLYLIELNLQNPLHVTEHAIKTINTSYEAVLSV